MFCILVVCTGNTCRSPMAEWILRAMLDEQGLTGRVLVASGGLSACEGTPISEGAMRILQARSFADAAGHQASAVTAERVETADLILTMTSFHKMSLLQTFAQAQGKVYTVAEYAQLGSQDISDPYGGDDLAYQQAADLITEASQAITARIARELGKSKGVPLQ